jgi:serine/threonine protein kinase
MPDVGDHSAIPKTIKTTPLPAFDYDALEKGERIGTGGDANVYEASLSVDGETHRLALKEPRFEGTVRTETFDRFEEEAETWANLDDHKNIVTVHGYGAGSVPWIALEYMDGGTLADKAEEIDFEEALWLAGRIAEGIRHGHRHGIAHLDLKPSNILIRETSEGKWDYPKVTDWGLAKMLLEHSKSVEGLSPTYAAPEQFNADEYGRPDDVTDVYQLGTIIYELLTGVPPFTGAAPDVMQSVLQETPPTPSDINPTLPSGVDDLLLKTLSKEKSDRYEGILILRRELDELFSTHVGNKDVDTSDEKAETTSVQDNQPGDDTTEHQSTQSTTDISKDTTKTTTSKSNDGTTTDTDSSLLSRRSSLAVLGTGITGAGVIAATQLDFGGSNRSNLDQSGTEASTAETNNDEVNTAESDSELELSGFETVTASGPNTEPSEVGIAFHRASGVGNDPLTYLQINSEKPIISGEIKTSADYESQFELRVDSGVGGDFSDTYDEFRRGWNIGTGGEFRVSDSKIDMVTGDRFGTSIRSPAGARILSIPTIAVEKEQGEFEPIDIDYGSYYE